MKLVRARPKAREYMPEWAKCCPEFVSAAQAEGEMTVDLEHAVREHMLCSYCEADHGMQLGVMDVADKRYTHLELLDLDEGPA